jgi:hypothetical protein
LSVACAPVCLQRIADFHRRIGVCPSRWRRKLPLFEQQLVAFFKLVFKPIFQFFELPVFFEQFVLQALFFGLFLPAVIFGNIPG